MVGAIGTVGDATIGVEGADKGVPGVADEGAGAKENDQLH